MSAYARPCSQLTRSPLPLLTRVVFENIEHGHYYYVRLREVGYVPYDIFGRASHKDDDSIVVNTLYFRQGERGMGTG